MDLNNEDLLERPGESFAEFHDFIEIETSRTASPSHRGFSSSISRPASSLMDTSAAPTGTTDSRLLHHNFSFFVDFRWFVYSKIDPTKVRENQIQNEIGTSLNWKKIKNSTPFAPNMPHLGANKGGFTSKTKRNASSFCSMVCVTLWTMDKESVGKHRKWMEMDGNLTSHLELELDNLQPRHTC